MSVLPYFSMKLTKRKTFQVSTLWTDLSDEPKPEWNCLFLKAKTKYKGLTDWNVCVIRKYLFLSSMYDKYVFKKKKYVYNTISAWD